LAEVKEEVFMSREYAMSRVKDALEKSGGNHLKAQRLLLSWLEKDHTLLFGLVTPHVQSIITHAISHVAQPPRKAPLPKKISLKDQEPGEFGSAMLANLRDKSGGTGNFGEATPRGISKPGKTSKAHVEAINAIASAGRNKDKKTKK
jgi:hypothetical protein